MLRLSVSLYSKPRHDVLCCRLIIPYRTVCLLSSRLRLSKLYTKGGCTVSLGVALPLLLFCERCQSLPDISFPWYFVKYHVYLRLSYFATYKIKKKNGEKKLDWHFWTTGKDFLFKYQFNRSPKFVIKLDFRGVLNQHFVNSLPKCDCF